MREKGKIKNRGKPFGIGRERKQNDVIVMTGQILILYLNFAALMQNLFFSAELLVQFIFRLFLFMLS